MFGKPAYLKNYPMVSEAFKKLGIECEEVPTEYVVRSVVKGDDLPIAIVVKVQEGYISFSCKLAFEAYEERFQEVVWDLNEINDTLTFGSFRLNTKNGWVYFNYSMIYGDNKLDSDLIAQVIKMVITTVDAHDGNLKKILDVNQDKFRDVMFQ